MSPEQDDGESGGVPEPLLAVVRDPSLGKRRLPYLLGFLDEDDVHCRLTASVAVCLVAESDEEMLDYAVRRLIDRLAEDSPVEIRHALDYLAARNPGAVDDVLVDLEEEAEVRARRLLYRTGGGFARNEYLARTEGDRPIGRSRIASGPGEDDPRQLYSDDEDETRWLSAGGESEGDSGDEGSEATRLTSGRIARIEGRLSSIVADSRFDDLEVLSERDRRRYADVYRTVGTVGDTQEAVALGLFRLPGEREEAFREGFDDAMGYWADVDDHAAVLTVYDWGVTPHPWAAIEYADLTLSDRGALDPAAALRNGVRVASSVAHAHQHGVVHAAIDPTNVVYYDTAITESDDQRPLLANVGLTALYRHYVDPESVLDPRYAAPEYFDERFGGIDHATDIYGLGAVLYRLCTGQDPYTGPLDTVREQVLAEPFPLPSTADDSVPDAIDQIVRKATAKRKLKRYETVTQLERELRSVGGDDGG